MIRLDRKRADTPCSCRRLAPSRFRYSPNTYRELSFPRRRPYYGCTLETQKCRVLPVGLLYPWAHGQARPVQPCGEQDDTDGAHRAGSAAAQNPREGGCRKGEGDSHGLTYVPTSYWQACGWNSCSSRTHRQGRCCQERQICFRPGNLRVVRNQGSTAMAIRADVDEWRACRGGYHGLGSVSPTWEVAQLLVNA